ERVEGAEAASGVCYIVELALIGLESHADRVLRDPAPLGVDIARGADVDQYRGELSALVLRENPVDDAHPRPVLALVVGKRGRDPLDLVVRELRKERDAEDVLTELLRHRQRHGPVAERSVRLIPVHGTGVMDGGPDPAAVEMAL